MFYVGDLTKILKRRMLLLKRRIFSSWMRLFTIFWGDKDDFITGSFTASTSCKVISAWRGA